MQIREPLHIQRETHRYFMLLVSPRLLFTVVLTQYLVKSMTGSIYPIREKTFVKAVCDSVIFIKSLILKKSKDYLVMSCPVCVVCACVLQDPVYDYKDKVQ